MCTGFEDDDDDDEEADVDEEGYRCECMGDGGRCCILDTATAAAAAAATAAAAADEAYIDLFDDTASVPFCDKVVKSKDELNGRFFGLAGDMRDPVCFKKKDNKHI